MSRKIEPTSEYYNEELGCMVKVYPEKNVKRTAWMRGEANLGMKMRIPEEGNRFIIPIQRKNGKY